MKSGVFGRSRSVKVEEFHEQEYRYDVKVKGSFMKSDKSGFKIVPIPLVEAFVRIQFPGDARIDRFRGDFQLRNRDAYPQLFVPRAVEGEAPALQHYRFSNENQTSSVSLAVNSLAVSTKEYPGWSSFRERVLNLWRLINDEIRPKNLTRLGVRFVNKFGGIDSEKVRVENRPVFLLALGEDPSEYSFKAMFQRDPNLRIGVVKTDDNSEFLVDFEAFFLNREPSSLSEDLDRLHEAVENEFLTILAPEFRSRLIGEREGKADA